MILVDDINLDKRESKLTWINLIEVKYEEKSKCTEEEEHSFPDLGSLNEEIPLIGTQPDQQKN